MLPYFLLGLALLAGALLSLRWFVNAEPAQVAKALRWTLVAAAVVVGLFLVFAGRHVLLFFLLPALLPLLLRSRAIWQRAKAAAGPSPGRTSEVTTRFLRMVLDHDSGEMSGEILEGAFAGRELGELDEAELIALWRECRAADAQSAAVLEAYLDRALGEAWREAAGAAAGGGAGGGAGGPEGMSRQDAYEILGLEPGASDSDIRDAHRRLMQKVHPDHGGSNYLASKINRAKELLLGE
ncbi:MAG: DnaJ domain-containing protein [Kiloniellales bacterium]|nr:DnaJ domain-containing protein [Kiloniellales bacterium]